MASARKQLKTEWHFRACHMPRTMLGGDLGKIKATGLQQMLDYVAST